MRRRVGRRVQEMRCTRYRLDGYRWSLRLGSFNRTFTSPDARSQVDLRVDLPICSTHLLPDPTSFETPLLPTTITIALDEDDRGCLVRHEGLGGITGLSGQAVIGEAWGLAEYTSYGKYCPIPKLCNAMQS